MYKCSTKSSWPQKGWRKAASRPWVQLLLYLPVDEGKSWVSFPRNFCSGTSFILFLHSPPPNHLFITPFLLLTCYILGHGTFFLHSHCMCTWVRGQLKYIVVSLGRRPRIKRKDTARASDISTKICHTALDREKKPLVLRIFRRICTVERTPFVHGASRHISTGCSYRHHFSCRVRM